MSGFEVAGVVLGSLPLVLAALEHYAEGIATAKRFWRYKSEMRSLILQINTERSIFINTLEQLLTGIVRIEHMTELLSSPGGKAWVDSGVDGKLQDRLRDAYNIYLDNVRGMDRALEKMMAKLALGVDGKPQFADPNAFKQEIRRLKFSITKSEYAESMGNLKNYNQALARITKQSLELEPTRTGSKSSGACPNFRAFQDYAKSLYNTIRSGLQCGCQGHAVNLRLESRSERFEEEEDALGQTPFRVVFSYTSDTNSPASTWSLWKEADIRYIHDKPKPIDPAPRSQRVTQISSERRRVRFDPGGVQVQHVSLATASSTPQPHTPTPNLDQIQDLCKAIERLQQPQREICIGYLLDSVRRKHGIYPLEPPVTNHQQWATYSLRDILNKPATVNRRLTQHDKLRVAVVLASSVLQLYKTPWLDEHWGKDDVIFIHRPGASLSSIYEHPFISRKFTKSTSSPNPPTLPTVCRVIRNQTLFTLGVLLIELWYGKSIEELQMPCDLDCQGTPGVAWCTAERVVENEIEFEAGKRYSDAVRRCIRCDFDRKDMSLDNESFQQAVYDGVVSLLEKTLQQFNSLD
ncbi:hypothetical protein BDV95DRAFT_502195 [Massariosphaeria phaeospora]|uniref:DUF7580 domain-containing protein n=1 Tax=Massariosphaeria phaeospora TaxID=100035 RepID=A0A7C8M270_9PLEO|nr:hypothetical protein BDV95DRAFT_502195 [Massariosphaeria phaeospora]